MSDESARRAAMTGEDCTRCGASVQWMDAHGCPLSSETIWCLYQHFLSSEQYRRRLTSIENMAEHESEPESYHEH